MREELSTAQMAVIVGYGERTIQRWLASGKLPSEHIEHNRYLVDRNDLERLRLGQHYEELKGLRDLERRVDELALQVAQLDHYTRILSEQLRILQSTVDTLQSRLESLSQPQPLTPSTPHTPRPTPSTVPAEGTLPPGLVVAATFAVQHGLSASGAKKAISTGRLPAVQGNWKVGRATVGVALDEVGRARFLELFHHNPNFHQCDDPACMCHTLA